MKYSAKPRIGQNDCPSNHPLKPERWRNVLHFVCRLAHKLGCQLKYLGCTRVTAGFLALVICLVVSPARAGEPDIKYEVESLFPMYFFGGRHIAIGARLENWRMRASCIDGGDYDYEPNNDAFERNLGTGCGVFLGYFFFSNWHAYLFVEQQDYVVTNRTNDAVHKFNVTDIGPGIGYQYFLADHVYVQPALHLYWRQSRQNIIGGTSYELREFDLSPVIRIGYQF